MKGYIIIIIIFTACFVFHSCNTLKEANKPTKETETISEIKTPLVTSISDTTKTDIYDTVLAAGGYNLNYKKDPAVVAKFTPYFVTDICEPGNTSHLQYLNLMAKGSSMAREIKERFIELVNTRSYFRQLVESRLGNISEVRNCQLQQIPVYYMTPNIVQYTNEQNIKQFYTLDTAEIAYRLLKENRLIAVVVYINKLDEVNVWNIAPGRFQSYDKLVFSLKKEPLAFKNSILPSRYRPGNYFDCFGYMMNDRMVFSACGEGLATKYSGDITTPVPKPYQECTTHLAETSFTRGGGYSAINQLINRALTTISSW